MHPVTCRLIEKWLDNKKFVIIIYFQVAMCLRSWKVYKHNKEKTPNKN